MKTLAEKVFDKLNEYDPDLLSSFIDEIEKEHTDTSHLCTICHENWVDSDNGYDTCSNCLTKI